MLICGENVHSCCVQRRAQTHVKRFHTFACDAVGLQCWVNIYHEFSHAGVPLGFNGPKLRTGIEMYTYVLKHWVKLSRFRGGNSGFIF